LSKSVLETNKQLSQERLWIKCTQRKYIVIIIKVTKTSVSDKWDDSLSFTSSSRPCCYRPKINQLIPLCPDKKIKWDYSKLFLARLVLGQSTLVSLHSCRSTAKWAWKSHLHARWLLATRFVVEVVRERESGGRGGVFNSPRANSNVRYTLYMSQYSIGAALYCTTLSSILLGVQQCISVYTEQFTLQQYRFESKTLQCSGGGGGGGGTFLKKNCRD
jgi:hypothetical protein